jgi:hypothetical protein
MAMLVKVVHDNRRQRLLNGVKVKLSENGTALKETAGSAHGLRTFEVKGGVGTKVALDFSMPAPDDPGTEIMFFTENMEVAVGAGGKLTLSPPKAGRFAGDFNPRLNPKPSMVASGAGSVVTINIDLTFIDVTDRCLGLGVLRDHSALQPQVKPASASAPAQHYDVDLRILEFTKGLPVSWAVLIPPELKSQDTRLDIPALIFYRPTGANYTNSDNLKLGEFVRYAGDPPNQQSTTPNQPSIVIPFFGGLVGGTKIWNPYPNCGWERQIAECKKPFVFIHPFPHGSGFGEAAGATVPALMSAIVNTLWADSNIGGKVKTGLGRSRMIAAGFSFGGDALFSMLTSLGKDVDRIKELYLFDPNGFATNATLLTNWFKTGNKKLRMVAGFLQPAMLNLAKTLGSADATVFPDSTTFWQKDDLYQAAVSFEEFSSSTSASPNALSTSTRMFDDGNTQSLTAFQIEGRDAKGKSVGKIEVPNCSNREAAAMIVIVKKKADLEKTLKPPPKKLTTPPITPIQTKADLDHNLGVLNDSVKWIRHQWAVCGGTDKNKRRDRQEEFVGYLHQCLEKSGI